MRIVKKYDSFVNENMEMAKSIIGKKMDAFDKLKTLLSKNIGYIGKFTEYLMDENVGYNDLEKMYKDLVDLKGKNSPVDISKLSFEKASDKIIKTNNNILIANLINQFPSEQKKLIKDIAESNINTLIKVAKKEDLSAFISKISRYKDKRSLLDALNIFSKDSNNDREHVKSTIGNMQSEIVFENDDILIVKVPNIEDIKVLGSDTSWCILSQYNWDSYTKNRIQYILYDYSKDSHDPKFKIGFTLEKNGNLYAAHDILDKDTTDFLKNVLSDNDLSTSKIIQMDKSFKVIGEEDIDTITSKSTLASIELLLNSLTSNDTKAVYKLVIKLFNTFGYKKTDKNGDIVNKELTGPKNGLIFKAIKLLFSDKLPDGLITEEDFKNMDKRVYMFVKEKNMFSENLYKEDSLSLYSKKAVFDYSIDKCSDNIILKFLYNTSDREFFSTYYPTKIDYTKPIPEDKLRYDKDSLTKLSDRANKIYKEGTANFKDGNSIVTTESKSFGRTVAFLNYILGRKDICPDHDKLVNMCLEQSYDIDYPGLFTSEVDITGKKYVQSSNLPIDKLVKKDYPDTPIYLRPNDLGIVQKIMEHLDGHKILLKLSKESIKKILAKPTSWAHINKYGEQLIKMMKTIPLESGKTSTDGNVTIEVS